MKRLLSVVLTLTICFAAFSAVPALAEKFSGTECGDMDKNGLLDVNDITALKVSVMNGDNDPELLELGDMDADGLLTVNDITALKAAIISGGQTPPGEHIHNWTDGNYDAEIAVSRTGKMVAVNMCSECYAYFGSTDGDKWETRYREHCGSVHDAEYTTWYAYAFYNAKWCTECDETKRGDFAFYGYYNYSVPGNMDIIQLEPWMAEELNLPFAKHTHNWKKWPKGATADWSGEWSGTPPDENGYTSNKEIAKNRDGKPVGIDMCAKCFEYYGDSDNDEWVMRYFGHCENVHDAGYSTYAVYAVYDLYSCEECEQYKRGDFSFYGYYDYSGEIPHWIYLKPWMSEELNLPLGEHTHSWEAAGLDNSDIAKDINGKKPGLNLCTKCYAYFGDSDGDEWEARYREHCDNVHDAGYITQALYTSYEREKCSGCSADNRSAFAGYLYWDNSEVNDPKPVYLEPWMAEELSLPAEQHIHSWESGLHDYSETVTNADGKELNLNLCTRCYAYFGDSDGDLWSDRYAYHCKFYHKKDYVTQPVYASYKCERCTECSEERRGEFVGYIYWDYYDADNPNPTDLVPWMTKELNLPLG